jgi:hypothetical protein
MRSVVLWLVMASAALGQMTPKAVINAPKETISGDIVTLDASQSQGTAFKWRLCLEPGQIEKSFFGKPTDPQIAFSAGVLKPTTYRFALAAAAANANGGVDIDIAFHDLLIKPLYPGPTPEPTPNPPVPVPTPGKVSGAILLYESSESTQDLTRLILQLRTAGIQNLKLLDKDAKQSDSDEPVKQVAELAKAIGSKSLPRLIAIDTSGSLVADSDVGSVDDVQKLLASWGLK